jgi:hypothetical protein
VALKMRKLPTIRVLRVYSPNDADDVEVSGRLLADLGTLTKDASFNGTFQDERLYMLARSLHRAKRRRVEAVLDPDTRTIISIVGHNFPPA